MESVIIILQKLTYLLIFQVPDTKTRGGGGEMPNDAAVEGKPNYDKGREMEDGEN